MSKGTQGSSGDIRSPTYFTSNLDKGIEYPAFDSFLPVDVIAPLLNLIVDNQAYEFGRSLLYPQGLEEGMIPTWYWRFVQSESPH